MFFISNDMVLGDLILRVTQERALCAIIYNLLEKWESPPDAPDFGTTTAHNEKLLCTTGFPLLYISKLCRAWLGDLESWG
jgi:hypothetical protein